MGVKDYDTMVKQWLTDGYVPKKGNQWAPPTNGDFTEKPWVLGIPLFWQKPRWG